MPPSASGFKAIFVQHKTRKPSLMVYQNTFSNTYASRD
jgi:hypothetical protein